MKNIFNLFALRLALVVALLCAFSGAAFAQSTVSDACGNKYGTTQIGNQVWLTSNMRCNKYASQSERKNATLSTASTSSYTPYYVVNSSGDGYLYNYAAAVAFSTEAQVKAQTSEFNGRRQGICPNGWHVPTAGEITTLMNYVESKKTYDGIALKAKTGWAACSHNVSVGGQTISPAGTDDFGFSAKPTGAFSCSMNGYGVTECKIWENLGWSFYMWSASPYGSNATEQAFEMYLTECGVYARTYGRNKKDAIGVRCLKNKYTVKFTNWDGTVLQTQELYADATPSYTGSTPTRATDAQYTYTFKGWSPTVAKVTGDVTYTAQFTSKVRSYTIRFMNGTTVLESKSVAYGTKPTYTKAPPTKTATAQYTYTFSGWSPTIANVTKAQDYQAQFTSKVRSYTIRFMNGTTVLESKSVAYGTKPTYTKSTPTKAATAQYTYTFSGWSPTIANVSKAQDYQAQFTSTVRSYTIRFLNGSNVLQNTSVAYGSKPKYTGSTPTKSSTAEYSYTFSGWSPAIANVTGAKDYTAQFTSAKRKYAIKFVNYDGTILQNSEWEYGTTPSYSGATPTRPDDDRFSDYVFEGWNSSITSVTGTKTYTAKFRGSLKPLDAPENGHSLAVVSDICGDKYNVVKIGAQFWLAENIRCTKYDTESERPGAIVPTNPGGNSNNPYYQVYPAGNDETSWKSQLSDSQIPYLGTFFSWAAAVGFATGTEAVAQTTPFENRRQGICPNGWHLPTTDEWHELVDFIELTDGKGEGTAGKHLKTTTGWYNNKNGLDTYGFSALPADRAISNKTFGVGGWGKWWTSDAISDANVSTVQVYHGGDNFMFGANEIKSKSTALCVRCVKNPEKFEIKFVNYDGTELQNSEVEYGLLPEYTGETPVRDADAQYTYTFSGWTPDVAVVAEAATYTAQFSSTTNKYTVRFLNDDGTELQSEELTYGSTPVYDGDTPAKDATAQYTYYFNGWDSDIEAVIGAKDYTATYTNTVNKYTIVFKNYDGEVLQSVEVEYGQTPTYTGAIPEKPADKDFTYTFEGWIPEITTVTAGQTSTAQFSRLVKPIDAPENSHSIEIVTDICGNKYNVVKIGSQLWLAENMRCNKYDTESEKAGQSFSTSASAIYAPYYTGCFTEGANVTIAPNNTFTDEQWDYLGLLYNWAAALGLLEGESRAQTREFNTPRQGICPNGYHVPSDAEWLQLIDYIENTDGKGEGTAAKHLKATSGWAPNTNKGNGLDTYGFSLLPVDRGVGKTIYGIGAYAKFTTASAKSNTFADYMNVDGDALVIVGNVGYTSAKSHIYTVRCVREAEKFEIKFVNYDGTELQSTEVEYGSLPEYKGDTPVRDADAQYTYTFSGWSPEMAVVTETATYTAQYDNEVNKYVVRFLNDDGTELQSSELNYGATPTYNGADPTKEATAQYTYYFAGWDSDIEAVTGAKDYTATYNPVTNKYLITFVNYNGEELQSGKVEYGQTPAYTGATPEKPADAEFTYTFSGWSPNITTVTGAQTYTAQFDDPTTNQYVVRFLNDDGTVLQSEELAYGSTPVYDGEPPTKDATAQYTYTFKGWDSEIAEVTGAKDYTATYTSTVNKYTIVFENYDGDELQSSEVEYGQTPSYTGATPEKPADAEFTYHFSGWSPEVVMVTDAATYTAQFSNTVNKYVIRFLDENGDVLQSSEVAYGSTPAYTGETPTKQATAQYTYTFNGWGSDIEVVRGAKDYTATYTSTTNKYHITFENYNGEELQSSEVEYGETPSYTGTTPEKPADAENTYVFTGWSPEITNVTSAQTYTAQFSSTTNKYTVRFLNEDGAELQSEELAYGTTPVYTGATPTKQATAQYTYMFSGWDSEIVEVTGAKDYTATYTSTVNKYPIAFVNYDGFELQITPVEYGQTPVYTSITPCKPADAEFTYTFSDWSPEITSVVGAQTYTAQFSSTVNKYVVRFLNDDGTELQSEELAYGATPAYTGETPTKEATAQYTYTFKGWDSDIAEVTGAKDYTATYTSSYVRQTADNNPACDNAPAVAKYDWLLMLNANAIKEKGYNLTENIVEWYRVVGEMDNLDSGERDDEKVGSGYYYTVNSKLNDTGDYYALIDLPWHTTEVGCNGLMRTEVFHYAPKGTTKRAMAVSPTITYPEQQIEVVNLPKEEVEVYVYDVAGRMYRSFRTDGEPAAAFKAEPMAGTYIVVVWTSKGKETFKYIVRKR